jgi:hypothetical protein
MKLKRTKQCNKCPWKVSTNPYDIPNGYEVEKHENLSDTIARDTQILIRELRVMQCHEATTDKSEHCIGWLHNQLGIGNNIPLRISMMQCENIREIETEGEQHQRFEDTLPS